MVAWCLENAQHFCILIFNSHTKANQIPEQPNEVDACLVVLWIVWILFLFERLNYPLIIAIRSLQPELIHIYTVVYDSVGWAKVAATFEGRRISGQKMERGIPFLIDIIHKIFIEVNDLKCQIKVVPENCAMQYGFTIRPPTIIVAFMRIIKGRGTCCAQRKRIAQ